MATLLPRADLYHLLADLVLEHERTIARCAALEQENRMLRQKAEWIEAQQARGYVNQAHFVPILPRKGVR